MKVEKCKNCTYYTAYYEQFSSGFVKLGHGYCSKQKQQQKQFDTCEQFKNNEQKEKWKEKRRLAILDEALNSINEIAQILKEKQAESR